MGYPPPGAGGHGGAPPKTNMTISIVSLVVGLSGCVIFAIPGIMAVVQAGKVSSLAQQGHLGAAQEASAKARRYAIIGLVISGVAAVIGIGLFVLAIALSDDSTSNALAAV
jgi:hypothetical protein